MITLYWRAGKAHRQRVARSWALGLVLGGGLALPVHAERLLPLLAPAESQALGVRTAAVPAATGLPLAGLSASVRAPLAGAVVVTVPQSGVVLEVLAREGEQVARDQVLARLRSPEVLGLEAELVAAREAARVARARAERDGRLAEEGIIATARAQASAAEWVAAQARLDAAVASRGSSPAGGAPGVYVLRAPRAGRVLRRALEPGAAVERFQSVYLLADGDQVELELRVPAKVAGKVASGQRVAVDGAGEGRVVEVGGTLDAASQSVRVRAALPAGRLKIDQEVLATLWLPAPAGSLVVPDAALIERGGTLRLYAAEARGYRPVTVERLAQGADGTSVVRGDLAVGATVVVAGAQIIDAQAQEAP